MTNLFDVNHGSICNQSGLGLELYLQINCYLLNCCGCLFTGSAKVLCFTRMY